MRAPNLSRRHLLATAAATPLLPAMAGIARADGHAAAAPMPRARQFQVGDFTVTTLLDGTGAQDNPQGIFGMNVPADEFADVSAQNFIPADRFQGYFTPVLVEAGDDVILFDTGLGQGGIETALAEVGRSPADITHVVLTHMHPDHIGGLVRDGAEVFTNAAYITGQAEYDFWTGPGADNDLGRRIGAEVVPLAERMSFLSDGDSPRSGITAVDASGHTPGHMAYMIESNGAQILLAADLANHHVWSLAYPDWEVRFDADKEAAAAARRRILGMLAADRVPMLGYHMPFPAAGFVETRGDGFNWVPVSYQLG
ncbi:MBL fold metallo-hydrolase [Jannaschia sp. CCS1]|uniref:MBL fold metallo-hydrolase n=1 Tax=Jannaschia sp. (strain CCS1) TaxID=290400 RepID=UPI00006C00C0|nr:MBL fold metallo-hydrolase [Jannaschia sp. CCS1]ABD56264.1 Twin-arginine translocation pathway signal [Jannaschia sp. CCS1]